MVARAAGHDRNSTSAVPDAFTAMTQAGSLGALHSAHYTSAGNSIIANRIAEFIAAAP
jgi:hypothetical protein